RDVVDTVDVHDTAGIEGDIASAGDRTAGKEIVNAIIEREGRTRGNVVIAGGGRLIGVDDGVSAVGVQSAVVDELEAGQDVERGVGVGVKYAIVNEGIAGAPVVNDCAGVAVDQVCTVVDENAGTGDAVADVQAAV